jgi:hypothetical protein
MMLLVVVDTTAGFVVRSGTHIRIIFLIPNYAAAFLPTSRLMGLLHREVRRHVRTPPQPWIPPSRHAGTILGHPDNTAVSLVGVSLVCRTGVIS